jgi:hypothetical protein
MVVAQRPSDYVEMRRCALALASRGHRIRFVYKRLRRASEDEDRILAEGREYAAAGTFEQFRVLGEAPRNAGTAAQATPPEAGASARLGWFKLAVRTVVRIPVVYDVWHAVRALTGTLQMYLRSMKDFERMIAESGARVLVLPEDVVGAFSPLLIKAAHRRGVPSLILPYTIANQQEAFKSLTSQRNYQRDFLPNRIAAALFPRWAMTQDGVSLVRLPAWHIIGQEITRTTPPDPWMMNSGYANVIAVESEAMRDYYGAAGIPSSKLRVVGAIYDDELAAYKANRATERARLLHQFSLDADKPVLLVGGCPDQTKSCPPGFEFADIDEFIDRLFDAVSALASDYTIVFRPHPNYGRMGERLAAKGWAVTTMDTARLVALADAYVAFASATIRWAIACAIPVVNYDVFRYAYGDFARVEGVVNVQSYSDFIGALQNLHTGSDGLAQWRRRAEAGAARWGNLDGGSIDRIERLIEELASLSPVPRVTH